MFQKGNKQSIKRIKNITTAKILHFVILANKSAIFYYRDRLFIQTTNVKLPT